MSIRISSDLASRGRKSGQIGMFLRVITATLLAVVFAAAGSGSPTGRATAALGKRQSNRSNGRQIDCGYDPRGAADEWSFHRLGVQQQASRQDHKGIGTHTNNAATAGYLSGMTPLNADIGDTSVIEDDGTIVMPPAQFSLKKSSVLFTPYGDGYRISGADIPYVRDFGTRLRSFLGADDQPGDGDNGYSIVNLPGGQFRFFGVDYDTIYVGTNGYITFTGGDTSARISPSALASELPRIAPLWADLEVNDSGDIYYNRLEGRHIITWDGAGQPSYTGISTFQAVLYDDGRIAFVYRKVKAQASLIGLSPGHSQVDSQPVDLSHPSDERISGPFFQAFGKQQRLDLPALLRAFYRSHSDSYDTVYVWTEFPYDNGLGVAHSFNVRNDITGIGVGLFDRGSAYGSPARLSSIITMGDEADWPSDPQTRTAGLNSAIAIVCHEQGHRWLAYVRFEAAHEIKDDLLGRDDSHWSFLSDTRTNAEGSFTSLMEGNAWRDTGGGTFTTIESAVNYFTPLDRYLMGLRSADEVGEISYLVTGGDAKDLLRQKSPVSGFSMSAVSKSTSVAQIIEHEGPRIPDFINSRKQFRVAFVLLTLRGSAASSQTLDKISRYRDSLVRYFSMATGGRGSLDASLNQ